MAERSARWRFIASVQVHARRDSGQRLEAIQRAVVGLAEHGAQITVRQCVRGAAQFAIGGRARLHAGGTQGFGRSAA